MASMWAKTGVDMPTQVSGEVLSLAKRIAKSHDTEEQVTSFVLGETVEDTIQRQHAKFYRLCVPSDSRLLSDGLLLQASSPTADRFKLIVFDRYGSVQYMQDSLGSKGKRTTFARIMFAPFECGVVHQAPIPLMVEAVEKDLDKFFYELSGFKKERRRLTAGELLVAVYGDNFISPTLFSLGAFPSPPSKGGSNKYHDKIESCDVQLGKLKRKIENFQPEYLEAVRKYERAQEMKQELEKDLKAQLLDKEASFDEYIKESQRRYPGPKKEAGRSTMESQGVAAGLKGFGAKIATNIFERFKP
jgi:hypothetical protein